jgi:hypothetical protein
MSLRHVVALGVVAATFAACAAGSKTVEEDSPVHSLGAGGSGGGTGGSGTATATSSTSATTATSSSSGAPGACSKKADCAAFDDACHVGNCINGMCEKTYANDGAACDDGLYCTDNDACQGGNCVGGTQKFCPSPDSCHVGACDEATKACGQAPGNDGASCDDGDPCTYSGTCSSGTCSKGQQVDCSAFNGTCSVGYCDPVLGCIAKPKNDGAPCDDGLFCTVQDVCMAGACQGVPNTCANPVDAACMIGSCNEAQKSCVAVPGNNGAVCDDANTCTSGELCSAGKCGGGAPANNGSTCDDHDACTTGETCAGGTCGSGNPVVACVNGDGCCPANCTADNDDDCGGTLYMASSNGTPGFEAYDIQLNTWSTLQNPPATSHTELASDGKLVYSMGDDNVVYNYDSKTKVWSAGQQGPGNTVSQPIGFFKWTPNGLFYMKDGGSTLYYSMNAGPWQSMNLPAGGSSAGSYDSASGRIYMREYGNMGLIIIDTAAKSVVQHWPNGTSVGENSRTGAYIGGYFYVREWAKSFIKVDVATGVATDTGITPSEGHTSTDVDMVSGDIFIGPYTPTGSTLQVFHTKSNVLETLASAPVAISNHSTIVLGR